MPTVISLHDPEHESFFILDFRPMCFNAIKQDLTSFGK